MQVENDYDRDVYNGDLGVVSRIDMEEGELSLDFDGREVTYGFGELDELVLAYATTIHKAQGSEYPAVVIPLSTQHYPMLQRNRLCHGNSIKHTLTQCLAINHAAATAFCQSAVASARNTRRVDREMRWR